MYIEALRSCEEVELKFQLQNQACCHFAGSTHSPLLAKRIAAFFLLESMHRQYFSLNSLNLYTALPLINWRNTCTLMNININRNCIGQVGHKNITQLCILTCWSLRRQFWNTAQDKVQSVTFFLLSLKERTYRELGIKDWCSFQSLSSTPLVKDSDILHP